MIVLPPRATLFPYTTLFRSSASGSTPGASRNPTPSPASHTSVGWSCRRRRWVTASPTRSEEHTSELQSLRHLVCRLLLEKKKKNKISDIYELTKIASVPQKH